ncbi:hypothetical protein L3Q82_020830, partial [Scortum barcoo]
SDPAPSLATAAVAAPVDPPSPAQCLTADTEETLVPEDGILRGRLKLIIHVCLQIRCLVPILLSMTMMLEMPSQFDNTSIMSPNKHLEPRSR